MSEINAGIEIILERMKTHPDEFALGSTFHYDSKWGSFLREIMDAEYFDETEKDAVRIAIRETNREGFTGRVMQHLAGEGEASDMGKFQSHTFTTQPINPYYGQGLISQLQAGQIGLASAQQQSAQQSSLSKTKAKLK